ncbi:MAG: radical SAM protein [Campylobacterota bacterium]|nr:radical SAM protein [Campylobacterota bacterium]
MNLTFGPIPSRRFGMSLGIDLSPNLKQCNFDCLYCELKPAKTINQQINSPAVKDIVLEVKKSLLNHPSINVITFTANGEPTLYPYLSELIDEIDKIKGEAKTLILSNGGNIYDKGIQQVLSKLDITKLSLDCISDRCFKKLDRINDTIDCKQIVSGMIEFRKLYDKELITETLFVKDLNDNDDEINLINDALQQIKPNRVDIGTIDRPPAYDVKPIDFKKLEYIANKLLNLPVNITYKNRPQSIQSFNEEEIINLLKMRPLTKEDIDNTFDKDSLIKLKNLVQNNIIFIKKSAGVEFFKFNNIY